MIMEVMKPQIAAGSRGVSVAYGEILFRVWKDFSVDRKGDEAVSIEVS
jgi:Condensin II non structural maintenance of chromosomes subunit